MARSKKQQTDPTGQAANRNRATKHLDNRLLRSKRKVMRIFNAIPRTRSTQVVLNQERAVIYDYEQTAEQNQDMQNEIRAAVDIELLETQGDTMPFMWYWKDDVELPYRQGTAEAIVEFNQLVAGAIIAGVLINGMPPQKIPVNLVLASNPYLQALNEVYVSNFAVIRTLGTRTAEQVIQEINIGIQAGESPKIIAEKISQRYDVAMSNAKRIAHTEVNKAYNDAKLNAVTLASEQTNLRAGVLHISALIPTTRPHHAARHGNAYTPEQQLQWWNSGANRINCKCTVRSVLIDNSGDVVQAELQDDIKAERSLFDPE